MKLKDIRGSYEVVVSLGGSCWPAMNLRRHNLRNFSGPLDWFFSLSLPDVNRLLKNKFNGFMEIENMHLLENTNAIYEDGIPQKTRSYLIRDSNYKIISVHDFPIIPDQNWTATYPTYKEKINYLTNRFLEKITTSESMLFVRWGASYEEAVELQLVLSQITKKHFNILILHPVGGVQNVSELDWGIERVCAVKVPHDATSISTWDYVLEGIKLTNQETVD